MTIKLNKTKFTGIPQAHLAASPQVLDNGMPQVYLGVSADLPVERVVVGSLRLSPAEARDLAARLLKTAEEAEELATETREAVRAYFSEEGGQE